MEYRPCADIQRCTSTFSCFPYKILLNVRWFSGSWNTEHALSEWINLFMLPRVSPVIKQKILISSKSTHRLYDLWVVNILQNTHLKEKIYGRMRLYHESLASILLCVRIIFLVHRKREYTPYSHVCLTFCWVRWCIHFLSYMCSFLYLILDLSFLSFSSLCLFLFHSAHCSRLLFVICMYHPIKVKH